MIRIKRFAIGNEQEAYLSQTFSNGVNVLHSDDNNKGKTIVTQGIMYTLGNVPCFPKGFENYNDYFFIVELTKNDSPISICRKKDSFVVLENGGVNVFETVGEFKNYFDEHIYRLASINKDGVPHIIDPSLLFEMTFLPQDNRKTSNIINAGRYNKEDLINAVYSYADCGGVEMSASEITRIKTEIKTAQKQRDRLQKTIEKMKASSVGIDSAIYTANKKVLSDKFKAIEKVKDEIVSLSNERNRAANRKIKNETLLAEIRSLNRELSAGQLVCSDCGSSNISYQSQNDGVKFDITDLATRSQIISVIEKRIQAINESIDSLDRKLDEKRIDLSTLLKDEEININNYLLYKEDIVGTIDFDQNVRELDEEINQKKNLLVSNADSTVKNGEKQKEIYDSLLQEMNVFYSAIDDEDPLIIDEIFTKKDVNYSGSQGAVFLMSRIYAYYKTLNIDFPIIIDHFRSGELSSNKEKTTIELFGELGLQVLFTCTLKTQENSKYDDMEEVNDISFDSVPSFHLMNSDNVQRFKELLASFMLKLS